MLGIVSMAGNALRAFGNTHPAVKWGVIVLAFLLATEFVGREGIALYKETFTAYGEVAKQNIQSCAGRVANFSQHCDERTGIITERPAPSDADIAAEQTEDKSARDVAFAQGMSKLLASPVVTAPDGRRVHDLGIVPENEFNPTISNDPTTPSLSDWSGQQLYRRHPDWWRTAN